MTTELTDKEKAEVFQRTKMENFKASTELEGLVVPPLPAGTTLDGLRKKYAKKRGST